jgi:hypothetical protein
VSECLISSTNLKLNIRTSQDIALMMISSKTRFSNKSLISFRLDFIKIEIRIKSEELSNWFESESSSWRKTMISAKFWYLNNRRLARINLMIMIDLIISKSSDLMISRDSDNKLFWWSDNWTLSKINWTFSSIDSASLIDSIRNDFITVLRKSIDLDDKTILQVSSSISSNLNNSVHLSR